MRLSARATLALVLALGCTDRTRSEPASSPPKGAAEAAGVPAASPTEKPAAASNRAAPSEPAGSGRVEVPAELARYAQEVWLSYLFHGKKVGYVHTRYEIAPYEGKPARHVKWDMKVRVRRDTDTVEISADTEAWSDLSGRPLAFLHVRDEGSAVRRLSGRRVGDKLALEVDHGGKKERRELPIGPNTFFSLEVYGAFNANVGPDARLEGEQILEEDGLLGTFKRRVVGEEQLDGEPVFKVAMEVATERLVIQSEEWVTPEGQQRRIVMPRLGVEMQALSKAEAIRLDELDDIFNRAKLSTQVRLPAREQLATVTVRLEGGEATLPRPVEDALQTVSAPKSGVLEVTMRRPEAPVGAAALPMKAADQATFLEATAYEPLDDPKLQAAAKEVVGDARDVWTAARRINRFVHEHIADKSLRRAFGTAAEALETGEGDCTEHSVLFSALAKIRGIPTRLASGLIYIGGPSGDFGYHEWVEIWTGARWHPMDPTFGQDIADATHLKFTQGLSDPIGLREAGVAAAALFGNIALDIVRYRRMGAREDERPDTQGGR